MTGTPDPLEGTAYRSLRRLGEGGMGEVYEVEHVALRKRMVAKVLREKLAGDQGLVDRVRVEAQALAALSHPNIVEVVHFDWTRDGRPYFVMEKLEGRTVGDELRSREWLPVGEAISIVREALEGLEAAHQAGLVHRDIKLDNLFLHTRGAKRVVKILDFGIAKVLVGARGAPAPPQLPTAEGAIVGTPRYVSPEQVLGKSIDGRADVYSIGLVLYALIAGRGPFDDVRGVQLYDAHVRTEPEPPSAYAPQTISAELDAIVLRALRKNPDERFQTAADLADALERLERALLSPVGYLATTPAQSAAASQPATSVVAIPSSPDTVRDAVPTARQTPREVPSRERTEVVEMRTGMEEDAAVSTRTAAPRQAPAPTAQASGAGERDAARTENYPWTAYAGIAIAAAASAGVTLAIVGGASMFSLLVVVLAGLAGAAVVAIVLGRARSDT